MTDTIESLLEDVESLQNDDAVDFETDKRQPDGWLKFYVECPECHVPMGRTTVESEDAECEDGVRRATTTLYAVCPDCGSVASRLEITRETGPVDSVE